MRLPRLLCLTLCLAVAPAARAQTPRRDQELTPTAVRDHGWGFELARPDEAWKLLGEADARQVSPAAVAGLTHTQQPLNAVVIVEPARGAGADGLARLLLADLPLEEKQTEGFAAVELAGASAVRFAVRGRYADATVRYVTTVVVHRDHAYQLVCWGPLPALDPAGAAVAAVWEGFRFLPGSVPGRAQPPSASEAHGVGWRVRAGRFESAAQGLALEPPPAGWRLLLGDELDQLNDTAEVGLLCSDPELYLLLVPERAAGTDPEAFEQLLRARVAYDLGPARVTTRRTVAGLPVELTLHGLGGQLPADYAHGVVRREGQAIQVLAWWPTEAREAGLRALTQGLSLVRFLDGPRRAELTRELSQGPDPQNQIGRTFALRRGTYTDFAHGFRWAQPQGFWRVAAGQRARAINPEAQLFMEEPSLGLSALLIVEETDDATLEDDALHRLALQALQGPDAPVQRPQRRSVGPVTFRTTWVDVPQGDLSLRYLVATARKGSRLFQLHAWGLAGNVRASEASVWGILDGLQIEPERIRPHDRAGDGLRDLRCGVAFTPPGAGWTLRPLSQPELEAHGAGYQWQRKGEGITLIAACSAAPEQDLAWFERYVGDLVLTRLTEHQGIAFDAPQDCMAQGRPAVLRAGRETNQGSGRVDVVTTHRDRTFYAIVISDEAGNGVSPADVLAGLRWLD